MRLCHIYLLPWEASHLQPLIEVDHMQSIDEIFGPYLDSWILFQSPLSIAEAIWYLKTSMQWTNKYGQRGPPYLIPFEGVKLPNWAPFWRTDNVPWEVHYIISFSRWLSKPTLCKTSSKKSYSILSYAFSYSIFTAIKPYLPFFFFIAWINSYSKIILLADSRPKMEPNCMSLVSLDINGLSRFAMTTLVITFISTLQRVIGVNYETDLGTSFLGIKETKVPIRSNEKVPSRNTCWINSMLEGQIKSKYS